LEHLPWVAEGPNTLLNLNDFFPSLPYFKGVSIVIWSSSTLATGVGVLFFSGLMRQYTLMFPEENKIQKQLENLKGNN
jgi:hypothetical protein